MSIRIKNWSKHQHFKDRTPPWIKLYREILDDPDWHDLDGDDAKLLIGLWLIASEDETHQGTLPDLRKLAFRLRMKESQLNQQLTKLSHWLIRDDINVISDGCPVVSPETETEKRQSAKYVDQENQFSEFWELYGKKTGKVNARRNWDKLNPDKQLFDEIISGLRMYLRSSKVLSGYQKDPERWIKERLWEDYENVSLVPQIAGAI